MRSVFALSLKGSSCWTLLLLMLAKLNLATLIRCNFGPNKVQKPSASNKHIKVQLALVLFFNQITPILRTLTPRRAVAAGKLGKKSALKLHLMWAGNAPAHLPDADFKYALEPAFSYLLNLILFPASLPGSLGRNRWTAGILWLLRAFTLRGCSSIRRATPLSKEQRAAQLRMRPCWT